MLANRLAALLVLSLPILGQPLTQGERGYPRSATCTSTRKQYLDQFSALSAAQWKYKPAPDVWSAAEIAEHLVKAEALEFQAATIQAMESPRSARAART